MRKRIDLGADWKKAIFDGGDKNFDLPLILPIGDMPEQAIYSHALSTDAQDKNCVWFLELRAVTGRVRVLVDGQEAAAFSAFAAPVIVELTPLIVKGTAQELTLEIIPAAGPDGLFTLGGAALICTERSHFSTEQGVSPLEIRPVFSESGVGLRVSADIVNPNNYDVVIFRLYSPDGILLDTRNVRPTDCRADFFLAAPMLWEGQHANYRYRVDAVLQRDAAVLDDVSVTFGVRDAELTKDGFYSLNGIKLPLSGAYLNNVKSVGDAVDAVTALDANAVFTGTLDPGGRLLDVCDRLGLMLVYRFPCTGDEKDVEELKRLLPLLRTHPCVAFITYRGEDLGYAKAFCRAVHEGAPGVFCAGESDALTEDSLSAAVPDALLLSVDTARFDHDFDALAQRFGALCEAHPEYRYLVFAKPPECIYDRHSAGARRPDCSQEYFSLWHEKVWGVFGNRRAVVAYCAGPLTDADPARERTGLMTCDYDLKKDAFWFYRAQISLEGFVRMASLPSSTTSKYVDVKCYSNLQPLTLTVGGKTNKKRQCQRLSDSVYLFKDVKLRRKNNTLVLGGGNAADSAVIFRSRSKLEKK
ncbi:MAG: hypothetical protein IK104_10200 [Clostridia bacterium]|nr:hypothetical protein [Clostridia bacterium]